MDHNYMSSREVCKILRCSRGHLKTLRDTEIGGLPFIKVSERKYLYRDTDVKAFLNRNRRGFYNEG